MEEPLKLSFTSRGTSIYVKVYRPVKLDSRKCNSTVAKLLSKYYLHRAAVYMYKQAYIVKKNRRMFPNFRGIRGIFHGISKFQNSHIFSPQIPAETSLENTALDTSN